MMKRVDSIYNVEKSMLRDVIENNSYLHDKQLGRPTSQLTWGCSVGWYEIQTRISVINLIEM